jgi:hypothetical protein
MRQCGRRAEVATLAQRRCDQYGAGDLGAERHRISSKRRDRQHHKKGGGECTMKQGEGRWKVRMSQSQSGKAKTAQHENRKKDDRIEH